MNLRVPVVTAVAAVLTMVLTFPGATPSGIKTVRADALRADLDYYFAELERNHPSPYHDASAAAMRAAADRIVANTESLGENGVLVELMRLVAMLGERDGHAVLSPLGSFTGDQHRRTLHAYPFWPYRFSDGVYVVATAGPALVGNRLVAVEGRPIDDVLARLEPLMTRDNEQTLLVRASMYLISAEVLHGLGITSSVERATFTFETPAGVRTETTLTALTVPAFHQRLQRIYTNYLYGLPQRPRPLFLRRRNAAQWLTTIDRGRVVYLAYNQMVGLPFDFDDRLRKLVRRTKVRRVVVDVRNNGGGSNQTWPPVLDVLKSKAVNRPNRLIVLMGRLTFSAGSAFVSEVDRLTRAVLVGEPTGGAPNHWSDPTPIPLEHVGVTVNVPTLYFEWRAGERGLTITPDVSVDFTAADYFAGRDPVLQAALRLPR